MSASLFDGARLARLGKAAERLRMAEVALQDALARLPGLARDISEARTEVEAALAEPEG